MTLYYTVGDCIILPSIVLYCLAIHGIPPIHVNDVENLHVIITFTQLTHNNHEPSLISPPYFLNRTILALFSFAFYPICYFFPSRVSGEEAEQLEGSDEKMEESCRVSAKVRFLDDVEDMGERSDLTAIQVTAAWLS